MGLRCTGHWSSHGRSSFAVLHTWRCFQRRPWMGRGWRQWIALLCGSEGRPAPFPTEWRPGRKARRWELPESSVPVTRWNHEVHCALFAYTQTHSTELFWERIISTFPLVYVPQKLRIFGDNIFSDLIHIVEHKTSLLAIIYLKYTWAEHQTFWRRWHSPVAWGLI